MVINTETVSNFNGYIFSIFPITYVWRFAKVREAQLLFSLKDDIMYFIIIVILWSATIMVQLNRKEKNKRFHDQKCRRELLRKTKYNKRKQSQIPKQSFTGTAVVPVTHRGRNRIYRLKAPRNLSVFYATRDTVEYFSEVMEVIKNCKIGDSIFFDLSEVEEINPDALMYIIAIIRNTRRIRGLKIKCMGNVPQNSGAREIIEKSGFLTFVSSTSKLQYQADNRFMKISDGTDANGQLASSFCDFVQNICDKTSLNTKRLYPMIIELMTNTHQHAYEPQETHTMMCNWYIFAQDTDEVVHFVFLDTGLGIPKTVSKRFWEKIKDWLNKNDALYLKSALQGEFRSETRQGHRGKGLPGIYEDACASSICNLSVISGKGKCFVREDTVIETECLSKAFEGTLFTWDILKQEVPA